MPGNGGLDIHITRSFNKNGWPDRNHFGNWELEIPRITMIVPNGMVHGTGNKNQTKYCKHIEQYQTQSHKYLNDTNHIQSIRLILPGESPKELFYPSEHYPFPDETLLVTNNYTVIRCLDDRRGFKVQTPDGKTYQLDVVGSHRSLESVQRIGDRNFDSDKVRVTYYASQITDRNGNQLHYQYDYTHVQHLDPRGGNSISAFNVKPHLIQITSSDGRLVSLAYDMRQPSRFSLDNLPQISSIKSHGIQWHYRIAGNTLKSVRRPDGNAWHYKYKLDLQASSLLEKVTTPTGATAHYDYDTNNLRYFYGTKYSKELTLNSIKKRTLTGPELSKSTWRYAYTIDSELNQHITTIDTQSGKKTFYRFKRAAHSRDNAWDIGVLQQIQVIDTHHNTPLRTTDYLWQYTYPIGKDVLKRKYTAEWQKHPNVIKQIKVDDRYTTHFSDFDQFNHPRTQGETGDLSRTTYYEYLHLASPWVIGLTTKIKIDGAGDTLYLYDEANGNLLKETKFGLSTDYEYHSSGDLLARKWVKDGKPHSELFQMYKRGKPQQTRKANGFTISQAINDTGTVKSKTDAKGNTTYYQYDGLKRVTQIKPPLRCTTTYSRPSPLTEIMSCGRLEQTTNFNALLRPMTIIEKDTETGDAFYTKHTFDTLGRLVFKTRRSRNVNETLGYATEYDALNRPITVTDTADMSSIRTCYNRLCSESDGTLTQVTTDAKGYKTHYTYKAFGSPDDKHLTKISQQVDGSGKEKTTRILYNVLGQMTSATQGQYSRHYHYNEHYQLKSIEQPEIGIISLTYDEVGNPITRQVNNALPTRLHYDELNRITDIIYPDNISNTHYQYDANGNLSHLRNPHSEWTYSYSPNNQLTQEALSIDGDIYTISYLYNHEGAVEKQTLPSGYTINYKPNAFGQATQLNDWVLDVQFYADKSIEAYRLKNGLNYLRLVNTKGLPVSLETSSPTLEVIKLTYGYDKNDNTKSIIDHLNPSHSIALAYDGLNQMTHANGPWGDGHYEYDIIGNITQKSLGEQTITYHYDESANRLSHTMGTHNFAMTYDLQGNAIRDGEQTYTYDDASTLINVRGNHNIDYQYDGHKRRVKKLSDNNNQITLYSKGGQLIYKKDLNNNTAYEYLYLQGQLIGRIKHSGDSSQMLYYHTDMLGTPIAATNDVGDILWREWHKPYGEKLLKEYTAEDNERGFTSHLHDEDIGLTYMQSRYYSPILGRFLAIDPRDFSVENLHSFNRYAYANLNPYKYLDPDGEHPVVVGFRGLQALAIGFGLYDAGKSYMESKSARIGITKAIINTVAAIAYTRALAAIASRSGALGKLAKNSPLSKSKSSNNTAVITSSAALTSSVSTYNATMSFEQTVDSFITGTAIGMLASRVPGASMMAQALKGAGANFIANLNAQINEQNTNTFTYEGINGIELGVATITGAYTGALGHAAGPSLEAVVATSYRAGTIETAATTIGKASGD